MALGVRLSFVIGRNVNFNLTDCCWFLEKTLLNLQQKKSVLFTWFAGLLQLKTADAGMKGQQKLVEARVAAVEATICWENDI